MKLAEKKYSQRKHAPELSQRWFSFPSSQSSLKTIRIKDFYSRCTLCGHDFKYKGVTAYKSITFQFKL